MAKGIDRVEVPTPDGARLRVFIAGSGRDLMLVSGLGGTATFWDDASDKLSARHRVIWFDQRGISASTRGTAPCTIAQLGLDCATILDALGSRRTVMLGHSTGGCIAMALGQQAAERLDGLILSATWAGPNRHMQALFGARRALLDHDPQSYAAMACLMTYPPVWLEVNWQAFDAALARAALSSEATQVVRERIDALLAFDGRSILAGLTMPSLVLGARDDMIVTAYLQEELAFALPDARLELLESGGHFFPHTHQDRFIDMVSAFMDKTARLPPPT